MMTMNTLFFQMPSTSLMELVISMYDFVTLVLSSVMMMVSLISLNFVYTKMFSSNFSENHELELIWTIMPMFILLFILLPSLESLYMLDTCIFCGLDINVLGHQWYWSYSYKNFKDLYFDSYMLSSDVSVLRLLDVDNRLVVPTFTPIRMLVSSTDVIHSWTVPSFGVKMDAIPGRINQFCFSLKRCGIFFGQCSEICGANHSFMPIVVESVPFDDFISLF